MKAILLVLSLLAIPVLARANDASFEGIAGSARPLKGENSAIRMVSEKVVLTANANDFSTDATFLFRNETRRRLKVPMGFPEGNYGDVASAGPLKESGFTLFTSFVDGKKVPARRTVLSEAAAETADFDTYWLKTVEFGPLQTRRVRVLARSPYGGRAAFGLVSCLSYDFSGQNWRGNVAPSDLEIRVPMQGLWMVVGEANNKPLDFRVKTGEKVAVLTRSWTNWPAKLSVSVGLQRAIPFWLADVGRVSNTNDGPFFKATQTFRVGAKPQTMERYGDIAPSGFVRDGVTYVALSEISGYANAAPSYDAKTRVAQLVWKGSMLIFEVDSRRLRWKNEGVIKLLAFKAPPLLVRGASSSTLFVPLQPTAQILGLTAKADLKTRLLTIARAK